MERLNLTRLREGTKAALEKKALKAKVVYHGTGQPNVSEYAHRVLEEHAGTRKP